MAEKLNELAVSNKRIETSLMRISSVTQRRVPDSMGYPWEVEDRVNHIRLLDALGNMSFIPYEVCTSKEVH